MLLAEGVEARTGVDIPGTIEGKGRFRRYGSAKVDIPELGPPPEDTEVQVGPEIPEDISFTYPEQR